MPCLVSPLERANGILRLLLAALSPVEDKIWGDLVAVAVLAGGKGLTQVAAQVSQTQLFVQVLLLGGEEFLMLFHLKQPADAQPSLSGLITTTAHQRWIEGFLGLRSGA